MQTHNITDVRTGGVATSIANKGGIWRVGPSDIIMAATHANPKDFNAKLAFRDYLNNSPKFSCSPKFCLSVLVLLSRVKLFSMFYCALLSRSNICIVSKSKLLG